MIFLFVLVLVVAVCAKNELQVQDCGGPGSILTLGSLKDDKNKGPIDSTSSLTIAFSVSKDTHHLDPFDTELQIEVKRKFLWWHNLPEWVINAIGDKLNDDDVTYMGNSVFRVKCLFKKMYDQCLPPKGSHKRSIDMGSIMGNLKKILGEFGQLIGSGRYQIRVKGTTTSKDKVLCVQAEFEIKLL